MTESIKLSVIIPVYNIEKYLSRCLDSILAQEYKNLEIIAVDDGSKDTSGKILDEYAVRDGRIKVIHKENGGVSTARLAGVKAASGDYIGFVDGDDYIEPDMFKRLVGNAIKFNADISHCGYVMDFPNGRSDYYYNTGDLIEQDTQKGVSDLLRCEFIEPGLVNKIYKTNIVATALENNAFDSSIKINEDLLLNYYLFKCSKKSAFEDFCPYHYILRRESAATSSVTINKLLDPIKVRKIILDDLPEGSDLYCVVVESYLRFLVYATHHKKMFDKHEFKPDKVLKTEIKKYKNLKGISKKVLNMARLAVYFPWLYTLVRKVYDKASGNDKKYSLE